MWAPSAMDRAQVSRLSRLWFEALRGICAHVRRGGGGLTPSDVAPARLTQQQIDELCQQYRVADVLPLTPLQQGLLFHTRTAQGPGDLGDLYAVQLDITVTGPSIPTACAKRCRPWSTGTPTSRPASATNSTSRCRSSRPTR
ncbi:linear gramicidin synthetase subunit C domain protein [Mycobacterium xenopi 3993]|nr:linear gramicidin synthetase subunit C domain protein [Mycobacterium xenopi 3993]